MRFFFVFLTCLGIMFQLAAQEISGLVVDADHQGISKVLITYNGDEKYIPMNLANLA